MSLKKLVLIACFAFTSSISFGQSEHTLVGDYNPCSPGCYTYLFRDSIFPLEFWLENFQEPFDGAHSYTTLYPGNGNTLAGYEICFESQGVYGFLSYWYDNSGITGLDTFYVNVGQSQNYIEIVERDPCSPDKFIACKGSTVTYDLTIDEPIQGIWNIFGAENIIENGNSVTVTWGNDDFGNVYFESFDPCYFVDERGVQLIEGPEAKFSIENLKNKYCIGEDIFLINESQDGTRFLWDFGDGTTSEDVQPLKSYDNPGSYLITLMAYNDCNCSSIYSLEVTIDELYMPSIDCIGTICEDTRVTYTSPDDCGIFHWSVSDNGFIVDGGNTSDNFITIQWKEGAEGLVNLELESCSIDICPTPGQFLIPIISKNAIVKGNLIPCLGSTESYSITDFGATDYEWIVNGGEILAGQNSHAIMVKWNTVTTGTIDVQFNSCYLECEGSTSASVNITDAFVLLGETKFCNNSTVSQMAQSVNGNNPVTVDWIFNDNVQQSGTDFNYLDNSLSGTYKLYGYSNEYCNLVDSVSIIISEQTKMVDSISGELSICPGSTYQYEAHSDIQNNTVKWNILDGSTSVELIGNPIVYEWKSDGPFKILVSQKDNNGDFCYSDPLDIEIGLVTELNITGQNEICKDEYGYYQSETYEGLKYNWSVVPEDAGTVIHNSEQNTVEILWVQAGVHKVVLEACDKQVEYLVDVAEIPSFNLDFIERVCYNEASQVSLDQNFIAYEWRDEFGVFKSNLESPFLSPGSYTVQVINERGCFNLENFTIQELPKPEIHISTPDSTGICLDSSFNYPTLYAVNSTEGYTYEWYRNGATLGSSANTLLTDSLGNYNVLVTDHNGCTSFSNTIRVFEYCGKCSGGPSTGTTCNYPQDCESNDGILSFDFTSTSNCRTLNFINNSANVTPGTFTWNFEDFQSGSDNISTEENPSHTFTNPGFYVVSLKGEVSDANNPGQFCEAWVAEVVTVPLKASFKSITGCPGSPIEFIDRSTFIPGFEITSYEWDFGDPSSGAANYSNSLTPLHTYDLAGTYDVTLIVGNGGCTDTFISEVVIYELPEGEIEFTESMCEDIPVNMTVIPINNVVKTFWNFDDPSSGDKNSSTIYPTYHEYQDAGTYNVKASIESVYGCENGITKDLTIHENDLQGDITSSNGNPICEGDNTILAAPSSEMYVWSNEETNESIEVETANVYTVIITDEHLCTYSPEPFVLDVTTSPKTNTYVESYDEFTSEIYQGLNIELCEGQKFRLVTEENPDYTYLWNTGETTATYDYFKSTGNTLPQGSYLYQVTITDINTGCSYISEEIEVTVLPNPQNLIISANSQGVLCSGIVHTLSVQSPNSSLIYKWSNGESGAAIETSAPGVYFVEAFNSNGCSSISNNLVVLPGPDVDQVPYGCLVRCNPDTICMPEINGAVSYQWFYNGGAIDASQNGTIPELIINQNGTYELEVTDNLGCKNTSEPLVLALEDALGQFKGKIFFDLDGSGDISAGDTLMSEIVINLSNGVLSKTNESGEFVIPQIPSGNYNIEIDTSGLGGVKVVLGPTNITILECDQIIEENFLLTLDCNRVNLGIVNHHLCPGETITEGGQIFDAEGSYDILVPNSNGCFDSLSVVITTSELVSATYDVQNICEGQAFGTISIMPNSNSDFTFILNNTEVNTTGQFDNLIADTYSTTIIDEFGCKVAEAIVNVDNIPTVDLGLQEVHLCPDETITIGGFTYDSSTEFTNWIENAQGCLDSQKVIITESEKVNGELIGTEACENSSNGSIEVLMNTSNTNLSYELNDGFLINSDGLFDGLSADQYSIEVKDEFGCTIFENMYLLDPLPTLEYEIIAPEWDCEFGIKNASVIFPNGQGKQADVEWKNGRIGQNNSNAEEGWFHVTISNNCESISEEFFVQPKYQEVQIDMPNIFSPNQDGVNENFGVIEEQLVNPKIYNFFISDRMGRIVYNYDGSNSTKWNGTYHSGDYLPVGVYFYYIELEHEVCGRLRRQTLSGDVTIIR